MLAAGEIDWANASYFMVLLAIALLSVLSARDRLTHFKSLATWLGICLALAGLYAFKEEGRQAWQKVAAALVPGYVVEGRNEIIVMRSANGFFNIKGSINGAPVSFTVDTGASSIALTAEDARRAGLSMAEDAYTSTVLTANGEAQVAPVIVDEVKIGPIIRHNLKALVSLPHSLNNNLLGHEFLNTVASYEVRGDRLVLRY